MALVNNKITYKPKKDFIGDDRIWYVIRDNQGRENSGVIKITVYGAGPGQYPIARPDWVKTKVNIPWIINPLANDIGSGLKIAGVNQYSEKGARVSIVDNKVRYIPKSNFSGNDTFWYNFKDSRGRTNSAKVTVYVSN